jgi:hypothetical protein
MGSGLFSVFGKLISKIASKTAGKVLSKTATAGAKAIAKNALKQVGKGSVKVLKELGKEGLKEATNLGTQLALSGIDQLAAKATSSGLPTKQTEAVTQMLKQTAEKGLGHLSDKASAKLHSTVDNFAKKTRYRGGQGGGETNR